MKVFSIYFKIINKQSKQLLIYVIVFLAIAIAYSYVGTGNQADKFTESKTKVAFINNDENTVLVQGFKDFLSDNSSFVSIPDRTDKLQDALFYRDVEYIIRIPKGFTQDILAARETQLDKTVIPGSTSSIYTEMLVNKYLNAARLYLNNDRDISQEELVKLVAEDLKIETRVELLKIAGKATDESRTKYYFNFLPYILISIIVLGVSSIMMVFNNINIKRRNRCSPIGNASINLQILLGNIVFSLSVWLLMLITAFILYRGEMLTTNAVFYSINSLVFTLTALSMSFLVGILVQNRNAQSGIANVLSLGLCFLSGAFVPQEILSESVLAIAKFTPTYWYIKANTMIGNVANFNMSNLTPVIQYILIDLGFAAALVSVALVVSKRKQLKGT